MSDFYTLKGYREQSGGITETMEDYLEMICRHVRETGCVRVSVLARQLHVRPSSASKMVSRLREEGLVTFERYGRIVPTTAGEEAGRYLLWRHAVLHRFFCWLNHSADELRQVELVEHYMTPVTLHNLEQLLDDAAAPPASPPDG